MRTRFVSKSWLLGGRTQPRLHPAAGTMRTGDTAPGQLNGQGLNAFGAEWAVLSPSGDKIEGGTS
jgi:hypothetical protein